MTKKTRNPERKPGDTTPLPEGEYIKIYYSAPSEVQYQAWKLLADEYVVAKRSPDKKDRELTTLRVDFLDHMSAANEDCDLTEAFLKMMEKLEKASPLEYYKTLADAVERVQKKIAEGAKNVR